MYLLFEYAPYFLINVQPTFMRICTRSVVNLMADFSSVHSTDYIIL